MALNGGSRLGHYDVTARIGEERDDGTKGCGVHATRERHVALEM